MDEGKLGVGLPEMVDKSIDKIKGVLNACQPFNEFDAEANLDFSKVCRAEAAKIVNLIDSHDSINSHFLVGVDND